MRKEVERQPSREGLATPNVISLAARDIRINSEAGLEVQAVFAVSRLSRRFGLPQSTALAVAEANAWGCR